MIDRSSIKLEAKGLLRTARVSPFLVAAVVMGVQFILERVVTLVETGSVFFSYDAYIRLYFDAIARGDYDDLMALASVLPEETAMGIFFSMLVSLFLITLMGGFYIYCMGVRQGTEMPLTSLLDGLGVAGKLIWCYIQIVVRVALWSMLFIIPGIVALYRYRFAYYNLLTDDSLSASQAIALSCRQTAGMKMDLFVLDLSFIGWDIVCNLTYGLLNIWLMPYKTMADLAYFEEGQRRVGRAPYGGASGGPGGTPWEF